MQKNAQKSFDTEPLFIQEIIREIKEKKTVVFCGAGISFHSGLPLANDLVKYLLEKLNTNKEDINAIINSSLPFESFIESLRSNSNVNEILEIFKHGEPNANHLLLAKLAKAKYLSTILTTNFDPLIEKAFEAQELKRGVDFEVYYRENDLDKIKWNNTKINLVKIHGSVEDIQNMAITLEQVSSEILSEKRKGVIEYIFSKGLHNSVLVMGYSCSDIFDISIQIQAIRENYKKVVFLDHREDRQAVRNLTEKQHKNPFQKFLKSKWILYNTDKLVEKIWKYCIDERYSFLPRIAINKTLWKKYIDSWSSETQLFNRLFIVGQILFNISQYEKATKFFSQALHLSKNTGDQQAKVSSLSGLGNCFLCLNDYGEAKKYGRLGLDMARRIGDREAEMISLHIMGCYYFYIGDYQQAKEYFEATINIAREIGNRGIQTTAFTNLSNIYIARGEYLNAIKSIEQNIETAKAFGDKGTEVRGIASLGGANYWLGDYENAIKFSSKSLRLAIEIGDKLGEAVSLCNFGLIYNTLGDYQKSIDYSKRTICVAKELSNRLLERDAKENLGHVYEKRGEFQKAENQYEQALKISRDMADKRGEGQALGNLGRVFNGYGNYRIAISYYEQALSISREIGDKQGEGTWTGNIGGVLLSQGNYKDARKYIEKALKMAREIGDKDSESLWLSNLGSLNFSLYDYHTAKDNYEKAYSLAKEIGNKQREGNLIGNIGRVCYKLGDHQKAKKCYQLASDVLGRILGNEHPSVKQLEAKLNRIDLQP